MRVFSGRRRTRNHVGDKVSGYCVSDRGPERKIDSPIPVVSRGTEKDGTVVEAGHKWDQREERRSVPRFEFHRAGSTVDPVSSNYSILSFPLNRSFLQLPIPC